MTRGPPDIRAHVRGYLGIALGAAGLGIALLHIFGGPFAPQPTLGETAGALAGEMRAAAQRALAGEPAPAPQPRGWGIDRILAVAGPLLGAGALALAIVSALRQDPRRLPAYGAGLGVAAIALPFVWWLALLIAGAAIAVAVVENLGDILGE
jgi:hypothetical protein